MLLFVVLVNVPGAWSLLREGPTSPRGFHHDEIFYLKSSIDAGYGRGPLATYSEHDTPEPLLERTRIWPTAITEVSTGLFARAFGLKTKALGLVLDILSSTASVAAFFLLFRRLSPCTECAELATWVSLACVAAFAGPDSLQLSSAGVEWIPYPSDSQRPSYWMLRGVYTQLSYPPFAIALALALPFVDSRNFSRLRLAGISVLIGALFYIYVFAWGAALAIVGSLLALEIIRRISLDGRKAVGPAIASLGLFLALQAAAIFPALRILIGVDGGSGQATSELLSQYWRLPLQTAFIAICFLVVAFRFRREPAIFRFAAFVGAIGFADVVLRNAQAFTGRELSPYRFYYIYLLPLLAGVSIILLLVMLQRLTRERFFKTLQYGLMAAVFSVIAAERVVRVVESDPYVSETAELLQAVATKTGPEDVVASSSVWRPFEPHEPGAFEIHELPNAIYSLAGRHVLHQLWAWTFRRYDIEVLRRELLLGWLFASKPMPVWPCDTIRVDIPGDLFDRTNTIMMLSRKRICERLSEAMTGATPCALLREFRVDWVVIEPKNIVPAKLSPPVEYLSRAWSSSQNTFELYHFDRDKALGALCAAEL